MSASACLQASILCELNIQSNVLVKINLALAELPDFIADLGSQLQAPRPQLADCEPRVRCPDFDESRVGSEALLHGP